MRAWICSRMLSFLELPRWHKGRLRAADMFAGQVIAFAADVRRTWSLRCRRCWRGLAGYPMVRCWL